MPSCIHSERSSLPVGEAARGPLKQDHEGTGRELRLGYDGFVSFALSLNAKYSIQWKDQTMLAGC